MLELWVSLSSSQTSVAGVHSHKGIPTACRSKGRIAGWLSVPPQPSAPMQTLGTVHHVPVKGGVTWYMRRCQCRKITSPWLPLTFNLSLKHNVNVQWRNKGDAQTLNCLIAVSYFTHLNRQHPGPAPTSVIWENNLSSRSRFCQIHYQSPVNEVQQTLSHLILAAVPDDSGDADVTITSRAATLIQWHMCLSPFSSLPPRTTSCRHPFSDSQGISL